MQTRDKARHQRTKVCSQTMPTGLACPLLTRDVAFTIPWQMVNSVSTLPSRSWRKSNDYIEISRTRPHD